MNITVNTDVKRGTAYNFWSTSVSTTQHQFADKSQQAKIREEHPFARYINCVRLLGGINLEKDDYFRGISPDGGAICDFSEALRMLEGILDCGYVPRIVLDNVPVAMSGASVLNKYGNTLPPRDPKVWASYVQQLIQEMVNRFGLDTVQNWRFRVGTEPDLYPGHWSGSQMQYYRHYDQTVDTVLRLLPDAYIGPGNILDPLENPRGKYPHVRWGGELLDHCLGEANFVNGGKGTYLHFFAISWYGHVGLDNDRFDAAIGELRSKAAKYGRSALPLEIHEFSVLSDEQGRRMVNGDATEWAASWMADIAERVYRLQVAEVYQWATTSYGIPNPRTHVLGMLEEMADGELLDVQVNQPSDNERIGSIACRKLERIHLMVYRHRPERNESGIAPIVTYLRGSELAFRERRVVQAKIIDHSHSGYIHDLYDDLNQAGIKLLEDAPSYAVEIGRCFGSEGKQHFDHYKEKYRSLAQLQDYQPERGWIRKEEDGLAFHVSMGSHCVLYLVLE